LILARLSRTCCCVTLKAHLLNRAWSGKVWSGFPISCSRL